VIAAVFHRRDEQGVWRGTCDTVPGWPGVTAATFEDAMREADTALPAYVAEHFSVFHYDMTRAAK
jgi:predicted RNase H-like HicB family nuclease